MSDFSAFVVPDPDRLVSGLRLAPIPGVLRDGSGVTTYYYRTSGGTRGSTTSLGSIPAGAVIEREVTT